MAKVVGEIPGTIYKPRGFASEFNYPINSDDMKYMESALAEAEISLQEGDMPVGAVLVNSQGDIWTAHADEKATNRLNGHAERNVIDKYNRETGNLVLTGLQMYVTFEPCIGCAHAIDQGELGALFIALGREALIQAPAEEYGGSKLIRPRRVNMTEVLSESPRTLMVVTGLKQEASIKLFQRKYNQDHGIIPGIRRSRHDHRSND
jgi:tRNA(Arg) A34 adenosine deaminase TadA